MWTASSTQRGASGVVCDGEGVGGEVMGSGVVGQGLHTIYTIVIDQSHIHTVKYTHMQILASVHVF